MNLIIIFFCLISQITEKQKELTALKTKLNNVRKELGQLEKQKVGILAHIEKMDEGIGLTIKYIDELTTKESYEKERIQELNKRIAKLERRMKSKKVDLRQRLVRLYKWTPFYKMKILFSSRSLPEILSTSYYLQILAQDDQKAFFEFKSDWERYLLDKRTREELIVSLKDSKREKEKELSQLNRERREKNNILDRIGREEGSKTKLEKELKSAQRKLEEMIVLLEKKREKKKTGENFVAMNRGALSWPCHGKLISKFGKVIHPKYNTATKNNGIDIIGKYGENVYAVAPGKVVYADRFLGYGNLILVDHLDGYYSLYGHLAEILVDVGDMVTEGRIIARVGESGSLAGPMLHFELRKDGRPVNPLAYLK